MNNRALLRRYLIAGLLVWVPVWVTLLILNFLISLFDKLQLLIPAAYRPDNLLSFHIPGLGLLVAVIIVIVTGLLVTNLLGRKLVELWETLLSRIPLVRAIYNAAKQITSTMLTQSENAFKNVLLVEFPRPGVWSIGFQTSSGFDSAEQITGEEMVTIYIPTTPNPTSGYLIIVPRKDTTKLNISVDQALKMVISLGVVLPDTIQPKQGV